MLRPSTPADTPALCDLARGTGVFKSLEIDTLAEVLDGLFDGDPEGHACVVLCGTDNAPVGFAYYAPAVMTDRGWYLYWIVVASERQGRGDGTRLLRHVEDAARAAGGRVLWAETSGSLPEYAATRRFYERAGYTRLATVPDYYADGDDQAIYGRRLDGPA